MRQLDNHPILGQLNERERQLRDVTALQAALEERRRIMRRDGRATVAVSGFVGISGLFFMQPLPFYLVLALLVIGLPLVWRHLMKEAREFAMHDADIQAVLNEQTAE